jgi:hypothetical protein
LSIPLFRWDGHYWGFLAEDILYDRHGRQVGWVEVAPEAGGIRLDVYDRTGRFLGELVDAHYVLRRVVRAEPIHRAPRPAIPYPTPPAPPPDRTPRDPRDGWSDALPWPLPPPAPPRV